MPRVRASLAISIASMERGTLSGSEWTWISITPVRLCAASTTGIRKSVLAYKIVNLLNRAHIKFRLSVVRQESINLLLDIGQLRITKTCESWNLANRRIQAAQPLQRRVGGLLDSRVAPCLLRHIRPGRDKSDAAEFGNVNGRTVIGIAWSQRRPSVVRHSLPRFAKALILA